MFAAPQHAPVGSGCSAPIAVKLEGMPNMGFFTALFDPNQSRRAKDIAQQIAQRCSPAVWRRAHRCALAMAPAEARGYLQAHAALVLSSEVASSLANRRMPTNLHAQVSTLAREILVDTLLREVVRVQKTTTNRRLAA